MIRIKHQIVGFFSNISLVEVSRSEASGVCSIFYCTVVPFLYFNILYRISLHCIAFYLIVHDIGSHCITLLYSSCSIVLQLIRLSLSSCHI